MGKAVGNPLACGPNLAGGRYQTIVTLQEKEVDLWLHRKCSFASLRHWGLFCFLVRDVKPVINIMALLLSMAERLDVLINDLVKRKWEGKRSPSPFFLVPAKLIGGQR